jgi:hypothetical protein
VFALVFFVVAGFTFGGSSRWAVAGLGLAVAGFSYVLVRHANRGLRRESDPEADYLVCRIEDALADVTESPDIKRPIEDYGTDGVTSAIRAKLPFFVMAMFLFVGACFLADFRSENLARNTLVDATAGRPRVLLNGIPVDDPSVLLIAVGQLHHVGPHHSSPGEPIRLDFVIGHDTTSINLARDSERPDEFWVYRPGPNWHHDPLGQEAGRIESPGLNGYLKSRGL